MFQCSPTWAFRLGNGYQTQSSRPEGHSPGNVGHTDYGEAESDHEPESRQRLHNSGTYPADLEGRGRAEWPRLAPNPSPRPSSSVSGERVVLPPVRLSVEASEGTRLIRAACEVVEVQVRDAEVERYLAVPARRYPECPAGLRVHVNGEQGQFVVAHSGYVGEKEVRELVVVTRRGVQVDEPPDADAGLHRVTDVDRVRVLILPRYRSLQLGPRRVTAEVGPQDQRLQEAQAAVHSPSRSAVGTRWGR